MAKAWETKAEFVTSESVLYDPKRKCLYISNFDQFNMLNPAKYQFISKLKLNGEIQLILHTENRGEFTADFEFIKEKKLLIIPTFYDNRVVAYKISE